MPWGVVQSGLPYSIHIYINTTDTNANIDTDTDTYNDGLTFVFLGGMAGDLPECRGRHCSHYCTHIHRYY